MGKKRRKMNKAQKRACVLPEINRPKNRKPKQRPNPLFFCEKRHFEIDSMIAKGTAIFVGEHQCVSQEIKVINFDEYKKQQYDILADNIRKNIDMKKVYEILEAGI